VPRKLLPRYIGPYPIVKVVSSNAYKLQLPESMKIHDVFNILVLRRHLHRPAEWEMVTTAPPGPVHVYGQEEYEIEKIVAHRRRQGQDQFCVKWLGYPDADNAWLDREELERCPDLLQEFEAFHPEGGRNAVSPSDRVLRSSSQQQQDTTTPS